MTVTIVDATAALWRSPGSRGRIHVSTTAAAPPCAGTGAVLYDNLTVPVVLDDRWSTRMRDAAVEFASVNAAQTLVNRAGGDLLDALRGRRCMRCSRGWTERAPQ